MANKKGYTVKQLIYLFISIFLMFIFGHICPTWSSVTPIGVKVLGVFLGWIILMISGFGLLAPSLLALFGLVVAEFYTAGEILANGFGNNTAILAALCMIFIYAFNQTGAGEVTVRYIITRKFLSGRPTRFLLVFFLSISVISIFIEMGGLLLGIGFVNAISTVLDYDDDSNWKRFMMTCCLLLSMAGSVVLPFKAGSLLVLGVFDGIMVGTGYAINTVVFLFTNFVIAIILAIVLALAAQPIFRIDMSKLKTLDVTSLIQGHATALNKRQIAATMVMMTAFIFPIIQMFIPADGSLGVWMGMVGQTIFMVMCAAALEFIHIDGEPICKATDAASKGIMWDIVIAIGTVTLLSGALASNDVGIKDFIASLLGWMLNDLSFPVMLLMVTAICGLLTQVFSNAATMVIVSSIIGQFALTYIAKGINVSVFPAIITQVSMLAFLTPAGSGYAAITLGLPALQAQPRWIFKNGFMMLLFYTVIAVAIGTLLGYCL